MSYQPLIGGDGNGLFIERATGDVVMLLQNAVVQRFTKAGGHTVPGAMTPVGGVVAAGGMSAFADALATLGIVPDASTYGTNAALVNTEYYVAEVFVPCNMSVTGIKLFNGATASTDSRHAALVNSDGTLITGAATGAVAIAGADVYQAHPFSGGAVSILGPASYFVAFIASGATDKYNAHPAFPGIGRAGKITSKTYGAIEAFTPPTTFTADLGPIASLY